MAEADSAPARRYAAARNRAAHPELTEFAAGYGFDFDPFQIEAGHALEDGESVLVCAPTGAGKTVVGEFAAHLALRQGGKCFYTTPIKALSNQKHADLVARHGPRSVGLLTGDTAVNGDAPIVVMTTEVLRNMLYAGSAALDGLGFVVLDEVHYLADRFRGAVWEEVIIHLPAAVRLASLSATVSNAEEFGDWLVTVRGHTRVVVSEERPVPLWQHMLVGRRLFDLLSGPAGDEVPPELARAINEAERRRPHDADLPRGRAGHDADLPRGRRAPERRPLRPRPPDRVEVVRRLDNDGLLPAIVFIFSRAGCDAAARRCATADLVLVSPEERAEIVRIVEARTAGIAADDLHVLGYWEWRDALERGVAAHHAGLIPAFKEAAEEAFARGLVKVVFATETLALGVNMPARSVVLERLVKYNGEELAEVTAGEYTQLTGRAGRRGIDIEGHAVVLWSPGVDPRRVAGLASTRTYPLRSSFRPSYNMAVNLVAQIGPDAARALLGSSFAQFQTDRAAVGLARRIDKDTRALGECEASLTCDLGDVVEYAALCRELSAHERAAAHGRRAANRAAIADSLGRLAPGDVVWLAGGRRSGPAVVVDERARPGSRPGRVREAPPAVLGLDGRVRRLFDDDLSEPATAVARLPIPKMFNPRSPRSRRDLASSLRNLGVARPRPSRAEADRPDAREAARLRALIRGHPCHSCPDRAVHLQLAREADQLRAQVQGLQRQLHDRTDSLARTFDRVCGLLTDRGYLAAADGALAVTAEGRMLSRIWNEADLVVAECLRSRVWHGLTPAALAAVAAGVLYEARSDRSAAAPAAVRPALDATRRIWAQVDEAEETHRLPRRERPDDGLVGPIYRWANGESLERALSAGAGLSGGDFVRWCRQVIDLLDQVAGLGLAGVSPTAARAVARLRRGVVAATS